MALKIFVDSDVVISSLISQTGAAFLLLNQIDSFEQFVSNISVKELEQVVNRLNLDPKKLKYLLGKKEE